MNYMTSGSSVHKSLKGIASQVETKYQATVAAANRAKNDIQSLREERDGIALRLTEHYLPELKESTIKETVSELRERVKSAWEKELAERERLETGIAEIKQMVATLEQTVDGLERTIAEKKEDHDRLLDETNRRLQADKEYLQVKARAEVLSQEITRQQANVDEFERNAVEPLGILNGHALFTYLLRVSQDPGYHPGFIRRALDKACELKIGFKAKKRTYDGLTKLPAAMRANLDQKKARLNSNVAALEKEEDFIAEETGLAKVVKEGTELERARKATNTQIATYEQQCAEYTKKRAELEGTKDRFYEDLRDGVKKYFLGTEIGELKRIARRTPGSEDDTLVNRMEEIDEAITEQERALQTASSTMAAVSNQLEGVRRIISRFTSNNYEESNSRFQDSFNVDRLMKNYFAGQYDAEEVFRQIKRAQDFIVPEPSYTPRRTSFPTNSWPSSPSHGGGSVFHGGGHVRIGMGGGGHSRIGGRV